MASFAGFWHGPPLTTVHRACLRSFIDYGHAFDLYAYEPIDAGPGIRIRDAAEILPKKELFYFSNLETGESEVAPFSDLFRLKVLWRFGGWWCDVDTMCLSEDMPECRYAWARDNPEVYPEFTANGILHLPARDEIIRLAYDRAHRSKASMRERHDLGAGCLSPVLRQLGMPPDMTISTDTVYPLRWIEMFKLVIPDFADEVHARLEPVVLLTLAWSFFKHAGIDLRWAPPEGSILDRLLQRHGSDRDRIGYRYTREEVIHLTRDFFSKKRSWAIPELQKAPGPDLTHWMLPELRPDASVGSKGSFTDPQFAVTRLFLSPHFDDAVGSCGGIIARLTAAGRRAEVLTVFGGAEHLPLSDLAATLHRQWGIDPAVAARKAEDAAALRVLGATGKSLDIPEAIYRRSESGSPLYPAIEALFGEPAEEDRQLSDAVTHAIAEAYPASDTIIVAPSGNGSHVDHVLVNRAARIMFPDLRDGEDPVFVASALVNAKEVSTTSELCYLYRVQRPYDRATAAHTFDVLRSILRQKEIYAVRHPIVWRNHCSAFYLRIFGELLLRPLTPSERAIALEYAGQIWSAEEMSAAGISDAPGTAVGDASGGPKEESRSGTKAGSVANLAISVAVCTFERYDLLKGAIDSLTSQTLDPSHYEILVIDNSPDRALSRRIAADYEAISNLRWIIEEMPGEANARNVAMTEARAPFVAFLDDDVIARPTWLASLLRAFERLGPEVAAIGGKVMPLWEALPPPWLHDHLLAYYSAIDWGQECRPITRNEWLVAANLGFRVSAVRQIGGFDTHLGRRRGDTVLLSNCEMDVVDRLRERGYHAVYEPAAEVFHLISAERLSQEWMRRRVVWQAVSDCLKDPAPHFNAAGSAWRELNAFAERRGSPGLSIGGLSIGALHDPTEDPDAFDDQMTALRNCTMLMLTGFKEVACELPHATGLSSAGPMEPGASALRHGLPTTEAVPETAGRPDRSPPAAKGEPTMLDSKYQEYVIDGGHRDVEGWLEDGALSFLVALNAYQRKHNVEGAVAEIGVHHGRCFIALSLMRRGDEHGVAVDVFEHQELNPDGSGHGDYAKFTANLAAFGVADRQAVLAQDSLTVKPAEIVAAAGGQRVRLFSVDGSHTAEHTKNDLTIAKGALAPGGVVVLDDWFNPEWPGVMEGFFAFMRASRGALLPFAYGNGKLLLASSDSYARYYEFFGRLLQPIAQHYKSIVLCGHPVHYFRLPEPAVVAPLAAAHIGTMLDAEAPDPDAGGFGRGWGDPEGWGRWTVAEVAEMTIAVPPDSGPSLQLWGCVASFSEGGRPTQVVTLQSGGRSLGEWVVDNQEPAWRCAAVTLPAGFAEPTIDIQLSFATTQSPAALGLSNDTRNLGIRATQFVLG